MFQQSRIAFFLISFISLVNISQAQVNVDDVVFDKEIFDFGEVAFGETQIIATYIFTNNSTENFVIRKVTASCGCTVPKWPQNPILPGMKGVITARFDPSHLAGEVDKSIEIFANYNNVMSKVLRIQGIIREPIQQDLNQYIPGQMGFLRLSAQVLGFGQIKNTKSYTKEILLVNDYPATLNIRQVEKKPDWAEVSFSKKDVVPGDTIKILVTIDGTKIDDFGIINDKILFSTNDIYFKTKAINLAIEVESDFSQLSKKEIKKKATFEMTNRTFDLGNVQKGAKTNIPITIRNTGYSTLKILKIKSDCSCTLINNLSDEVLPKTSVNATLTFDSIFLEGKASKEIIIYTNDPANPKVIIKVYANVLTN